MKRRFWKTARGGGYQLDDRNSRLEWVAWVEWTWISQYRGRGRRRTFPRVAQRWGVWLAEPDKTVAVTRHFKTFKKAIRFAEAATRISE